MVSVIEGEVCTCYNIQIITVVAHIQSSGIVSVIHSLADDNVCLLVGYAVYHLILQSVLGELYIVFVVLIVAVTLGEVSLCIESQ